MGIAIDEAWYWFVNIKFVGRQTRCRLLEVFESPVEIFETSESLISKLSFLTERQRNSIITRNIDCIRTDLDKLYNSGINFLYIECDGFPKELLNIPDCPHCLYVKGQYIDWFKPAVSVVGSRNCSSYGGNFAYKLGRELAEHGISVVSGMARGIDGAAQKGCIAAGGRTCAVLGCGVDVCYPESNIDLYMNITNNGCIVSEYPPGTPPLSGFFPERNRIISGLGKVLIVVEAGERSGSLITVDCALEQGKDVFAVPGRVTDQQSRGCNCLIKNGASIFESIDDILDAINVTYFSNIATVKKSNIALATDEKIVYAELGFEPKHINSLARETKMPVEVVMRILINLELRHIVRQTTGNYFVVDL